MISTLVIVAERSQKEPSLWQVGHPHCPPLSPPDLCRLTWPFAHVTSSDTYKDLLSVLEVSRLLSPATPPSFPQLGLGGPTHSSVWLSLAWTGLQPWVWRSSLWSRPKIANTRMRSARDESIAHPLRVTLETMVGTPRKEGRVSVGQELWELEAR